MVKILCIIPARGNSKRFPRKNVAKLKGKPLISYSIQAAQESKKFDKIILSSEDEDILAIARSMGAVALKRPEELSTDDTGVAEVCLDLIDILKGNGEQYDFLCILLPTSPLRSPGDISSAIEKFEASDADYLMSTTDYRYSPFRALQETGFGYLKPFFGEKYLKRDQLNPNVVVHNGCIILARINQFQKDKGYYGEKLIGYQMPFERSIDINEPVDLKIADALLRD